MNEVIKIVQLLGNFQAINDYPEIQVINFMLENLLNPFNYQGRMGEIVKQYTVLMQAVKNCGSGEAILHDNNTAIILKEQQQLISILESSN